MLALTLTHSTNFTRILFSIVLWIMCVTVLCVTEVCAQYCVTEVCHSLMCHSLMCHSLMCHSSVSQWTEQKYFGHGAVGGLEDWESIGVKADFNRTLLPQATQRRPLPVLASAPKIREYVSDLV